MNNPSNPNNYNNLNNSSNPNPSIPPYSTSTLYADPSNPNVELEDQVTQPKIVDFSMHTLSDADTTAAIFARQSPYILVLANNLNHTEEWKAAFEKGTQAAAQKNMAVILVTADAGKAVSLFANTIIVKCDATVLKTAARVTPTFFLMKGAVVAGKFSYADIDKLLPEIAKQ